MDKLDKKKATSTAKDATKKGALDSEDNDAQKGGKSDKLKQNMATENNPKNDDVLKDICRKVFASKRNDISKHYDDRAIKSDWTDDDGNLSDDGTKARFLQTMPDYCFKAIKENLLAFNPSDPDDIKANIFYDQYINDTYKYTNNRVKKVKKRYIKKGASAIVSGWDVLNAFGLYKQIGRDEGNFVTSLKEDLKLFKNEEINYDGLINNDPNAEITEDKAKAIALAKGLKETKYLNDGVYQYYYSPEFIRNANSKKQTNGKSGLYTANGDMKGANPLNLPGMMTWVESKDKTVKSATGDDEPTADAINMSNSESELMVPTIKIEKPYFNYTRILTELPSEIGKMQSLLSTGEPVIDTKHCIIKDKDENVLFDGPIPGDVKLRVLKPAKLGTKGTAENWQNYRKSEEDKQIAKAAKAATTTK